MTDDEEKELPPATPAFVSDQDQLWAKLREVDRHAKERFDFLIEIGLPYETASSLVGNSVALAQHEIFMERRG